MKAADLYELVKDLPKEATCRTIRLGSHRWFDLDGNAIDDDHAEALQRDSMVEWLASQRLWLDKAGYSYGIEVVRINNGWAVCVEYTRQERVSVHPTRLHALAAAVKYVAGKGKEC